MNSGALYGGSVGVSAVVVDVGAPDADCCHTSAGVGAADAVGQILLATINMTTNIRSWSYLCSLMVVLQRKSDNFLDGPIRNGINEPGANGCMMSNKRLMLNSRLSLLSNKEQHLMWKTIKTSAL